MSALNKYCYSDQEININSEIKIYNLFYQNLHREPSNLQKIPSILHHIWLTDCDNPTQINESRVKKTISNIELLEDDKHNNWTYKIWSNCPNEIKHQSLSQFEVNYLDINEASFLENDLSKINHLITNNHFGMASDFLRYLIVQNQGGFYADIGFDLHRAPGLDMYRYDFFVNQWEDFLITNNFFASRKDFPSIAITANTTRENINQFVNNPTSFQRLDIKDLTTELTAEPINIGFYTYLEEYMGSEQEQKFFHAVIPHSKYYNHKNLYFDGREKEINNAPALSNGNICAADFLFIGQDELGGETWL